MGKKKKIKALDTWGANGLEEDLLGPFKRTGSTLDWGDLGSLAGGGSRGACYDTHPEITFPDIPGVLMGGSCMTPRVKDADVYIGFASGMKLTNRSYPWTNGYEFLFAVTDGRAPSDAVAFVSLVDWVTEELKKGSRVHAGCVGGHGRTGTFIAAVVSLLLPEVKNVIKFVREAYCFKAVESPEQVEFLTEHFGIKKADPSGGAYHRYSKKTNRKGKNKTSVVVDLLQQSSPDDFDTGLSAFVPGNVWGR